MILSYLRTECAELKSCCIPRKRVSDAAVAAHMAQWLWLIDGIGAWGSFYFC